MADILIALLLTASILAVMHIGIPYYFIRQDSDVTIDFHTFLAMYDVSPDSYVFSDAYNPIDYDGVSRRYKLCIRFPGYIRFIFWLSSKQFVQKEERKKMEVLVSASLMEDWKRDIERKEGEHGEK